MDYNFDSPTQEVIETEKAVWIDGHEVKDIIKDSVKTDSFGGYTIVTLSLLVKSFTDSYERRIGLGMEEMTRKEFKALQKRITGLEERVQSLNLIMLRHFRDTQSEYDDLRKLFNELHDALYSELQQIL